MSTRDLIQVSGETLASYIAKLEHDMMLSPMEVLVLAEEVGTAVKVKVGHTLIEHIRSKYLIILSKEHCTQWTSRSKAKQQVVQGNSPTTRGGIRRQDSRSRSRDQELSPTLPYPGPSQPTRQFGGFPSREAEDRYIDENYGPKDQELDQPAERELQQEQQHRQQDQLEDDELDSEHGSYDSMATSDTRLAVTSAAQASSAYQEDVC